MSFSEPAFLFWFLPWLLLVYFVAPRAFRNAVLLAASLYFCAWGESIHVLLLIASIVLNHAFGLMVAPRGGPSGSRAWLAAAVTANLLLLGIFKYAGFLVGNINSLLQALALPPIAARPVGLPLGISFYTFKGLSYLIDVYRGQFPPERSPFRLGLHISFFPQLIAGPIVRYAHVKEQLVSRAVTIEDFASGVTRFTLGLGKKMIFASALARPADGIFSLPPDQLSAGLAWFGLVAYALQIYLDFSSYSDMAIGLGRMFGFSTMENFDFPYFSTSLREFWRRWHISLSTWFRDYLYIPLGGNRVRPWRVHFNLLCVFFLCGLWHGASWNFVIWGLFHGSFLVLERWPLLARLRALPAPLHHAYLLFVVLVSWVFFRTETLGDSIQFLKAMFGFASLGDAVPGFGMFSNALVLVAVIAGALGSTPLVKAFQRMEESLTLRDRRLGTAFAAVRLSLMVTVLLYSAMMMAAGSYSPFIYQRF